jgi:hypothetical protein
MKIALSSNMAKRIDDARDQINAHFVSLSAQSAALDAIHMRKREIASEVKPGEAAPDALAQEAALRGITPEQLADLILSKPCPIAAADERELERQRMLLTVESATTPSAIDAVLAAIS